MLHEESLKSSSLVSKRLLNEVGRLETVTSSHCSEPSMQDNSSNAEPTPDYESAWSELDLVIRQLEAKCLELERGGSCADGRQADSGCFECVSLKCEVNSLRGQVTALEQDVANYKLRIDELSTESGRGTPPPSNHSEKSGPSVLTSASMRLKSVTAVLNKALHSKRAS